MNSIKDLKVINLNIFQDNRGGLLPIDFQKHLNISIKRSFLVFGNDQIIRGNHSHKECNQFLCCLSGCCEVKCDDGENSSSQILDNPSTILKIPNMIWASQKYETKNTILLVFCDKEYNEADYIREYKSFIEYRNNFTL